MTYVVRGHGDKELHVIRITVVGSVMFSNDITEGECREISRRGPIIDPCGTPHTMSAYSIKITKGGNTIFNLADII